VTVTELTSRLTHGLTHGLTIRGVTQTELGGRLARLPEWAKALIVFGSCQLVTALMLDRAARFTTIDQQGTTARWPYLSFVARWDSAWYRTIAEGGYPSVLPRDPAGEVEQNAWAFYPLFPMLGRALGTLGLSWPVAGWTISVLSALAAAVVLRSLVDQLGGPSLALWSVALLGSFTVAPVLQFPYSEALALFLLLTVLWCLQRRRYGAAIAVILLLGLARPIAAPLAVVVVVHVILRLRRRPPPITMSAELARMALLVLAAGVATIGWPVIAALATGERSAYTETMAAWRYGRGVVPVDPWLDASARYLGPFSGRVALVAAGIGLLWWLTRPSSRFIGGDLRVWCVAYPLYLLAVLDPTTSLARYMVLLFPLGVLLAAASPSAAYRRALVVASFVTQLVWIVVIWRIASFPP
jgi:hypothetical protein